MTALSPDPPAATQTPPLNTPEAPISANSNPNSHVSVNSLPDKMTINIIPAANIRNFGKKKSASPKKVSI